MYNPDFNRIEFEAVILGCRTARQLQEGGK